MALVSLHTLLSAANAPARAPGKPAGKRPDKQHVPSKDSALTGNYWPMLLIVVSGADSNR